MNQKTITITEKEYLSLRNKNAPKAKPQDFSPIEGEIWKEILNTNGLYFISNLGRLRKIYETMAGELRDLILNCPKRTSGHTVRLSISPTLQRNTYLHTLVMETFHPLIEGIEVKMVVIHLDCNTSNNHVDNLCWGTHSDALLHKKKCAGERPKLKTKGYITKAGKKSTKAVWFADGDLERMKMMKDEGYSQATIAKIMNCSQTYVCKILTGKLRND